MRKEETETMKLVVSLFVFCAALSAQIIPGAEGWDGPGLGSARIGVVFGNMACPSVPDAEVNKAVARLALAKWAAAAQIEFYEHADPTAPQTIVIAFGLVPAGMRAGSHGPAPPYFCLLYTSDAADERSSVDLGGRRIIKTTNNQRTTE